MISHYEIPDHDSTEISYRGDLDSLEAPEAWDLTDFEDIVPGGYEQ